MVMQAGKTPRRAARANANDCKDSTFFINRRNRFWEVVDATGALVCMTVYKRGAKEVVRRLDACRCASAQAAPDAAPYPM